MPKLGDEIALLHTKKAQSQSTVIAVTIFVAVCALLITGTAFFFARPSPKITTSDSIPLEVASVEVPAVDANSVEVSALDDAQVQVSESSTLNDEQSKLNFENNLTHYTQEFKTKIDALQNLRWSSGEVLSIQQMEKTALADYASGDYIQADKIINEILQRSESLFEQQHNEFIKLATSHSQALVAGRESEAQRLMTAVKQIAPNHSDVPVMEQYTQDLPVALERQEVLREYMSQNQYDQALDMIAELKSLQPYNTKWPDQEEQLEQLIAERSIASLTKRISGLISGERFDQASQLLKASQASGISRTQLDSFKTEINSGLRAQALSRSLANARAARSKDNWADAIRYYREALALDSANADLAKKLQLAEAVSSTTDQVAALIDKPLTLSDKSVGEYADKRLRAASELQLESTNLKNKVDTLTDLLRLARIKRSVQIVSDGKTRIEVQTVGFVEPTKGKEIQLYPGKYLLFAKCKNSKDNVVELIVPLEDQVPVSRVECGERI